MLVKLTILIFFLIGLHTIKSLIIICSLSWFAKEWNLFIMLRNIYLVVKFKKWWKIKIYN